jgi:hypothetical protein
VYEFTAYLLLVVPLETALHGSSLAIMITNVKNNSSISFQVDNEEVIIDKHANQQR